MVSGGVRNTLGISGGVGVIFVLKKMKFSGGRGLM